MEQVKPRVLLSTTMGDITVELNPKEAPLTVKNFLRYVFDGFYDGTIFHRVIPNFMIQGGGMTPDMGEKPTNEMIMNEATNGLKNNRGTLAMARTSAPHSASAQFFVNLKDNAFLNHTQPSGQGWGYAVFGQVVEGMEVVDAIAKVPTGQTGPHSDVPQTPVIINQARMLEPEAQLPAD
jgi:cyclophilin family peptidyl-prolyl cis-trans isomerase